VERRASIRTGFLALVIFATSCKPPSSSNSVSGTIETDEVRVASRYGGRVEKTFVQEGDSLKPGQVIVQLEAPELRARRDSVAAQMAELEAGPRKEEIEAARHDWEALVAHPGMVLSPILLGELETLLEQIIVEAFDHRLIRQL